MGAKIKANGKRMSEFNNEQLRAELDRAPSKARHRARMEAMRRGLVNADGKSLFETIAASE